jgi:hypothetical protein
MVDFVPGVIPPSIGYFVAGWKGVISSDRWKMGPCGLQSASVIGRGAQSCTRHVLIVNNCTYRVLWTLSPTDQGRCTVAQRSKPHRVRDQNRAITNNNDSPEAVRM